MMDGCCRAIGGVEVEFGSLPKASRQRLAWLNPTHRHGPLAAEYSSPLHAMRILLTEDRKVCFIDIAQVKRLPFGGECK